MSLIESNARNAVAMLVLNKLRHKLLKREGASVAEPEIALIDKSIEIYQSTTLTKDMIIYSFYSVGNIAKSSALELSDAIDTALNSLAAMKKDKVDFINSLKNVLDCLRSDQPVTEKDKELSLDLIRHAMYTISSGDSANKDSIINPITF
ncbi:hypothetical protein [Candidatus Magnetominusculus dajiuhuensis]|uniref:hypothetical protein n=1 Tax=Candidatus Magnetominusculus dajiuhuensis TaxID=3137712 RepID=UPI003B42ADE9